MAKDFSREARVVEFTINRDTFRGKPHLAAQTMIDFTLKVEGIDEATATPGDGFRTMREALQMVLMPDSYKRMVDRMQDPTVANPDAPVDEDNPPIELPQLTEVLEWVMGEYGLRPTQSAQDSSPGQPDPAFGTNSTVPTSGEVSISANSPSTDS